MKKSISHLLVLSLILPEVGWSQQTQFNGPTQGMGYFPSTDLATKTCPFTDSKDTQFKDDNNIILSFWALEAQNLGFLQFQEILCDI
jgi:hypothetical protein